MQLDKLANFNRFIHAFGRGSLFLASRIHSRLGIVRRSFLTRNKNNFYRYAAFFILILFSALQFILILRHKSPYLSDSYFYKHIFYQMKGTTSYIQAKDKIISQIDLDRQDKITKKIFTDEDSYRYSYSFFTKRPLYPFIARIINVVIRSEYLALMTPVFLAYIGSVVLSFRLLKIDMSYFFAIFALSLFISFYPFLDWSTYLLTDTIGYFFWLLLLLYIYKFIDKGKSKHLILYTIFLIISLLNREQSILMLLLLILLYIFIVIFKQSEYMKKRLEKLIKGTLVIILAYIGISIIFNQRTIIESINYLQNNYSFFSNTYSLTEASEYLIKTVIFTHQAFIADLASHHWWSMLFFLGSAGMIKTIFFSKRKQFGSLLIFSSGLASYSFVFIYPVLSYRFFYPTVLMFVYFASKFIFEFFEERKRLLKSP